MHPQSSLKFLCLFVIIISLSIAAPMQSLASFVPVQAQSKQDPLAPTPVDFGLHIISNSPKPVGETVTFTATVDANAPTLTFIWDFGDGQTMPGGKVIQHVYANAGVFHASAQASDGQGNTQIAPTTVGISEPPSPTPTPTLGRPNPPTASCTSPVEANSPTQCSAASDPPGENVKFTWDFADDSALVEGPSVSHSYIEPKIYEVLVTASNSVGVSRPTRARVEVTEEPIGVVAIEVSGPTYIDAPITFIANIESGTHPHYNWIFGDGGHIEDGPKEIKHAYGTARAYPVSVIVFNSISSSIGNTSVRILPRPPFNLQLFISPQPASRKVSFLAKVESDEKVSFLWDFGDGSTLLTDQSQVDHLYAKAGKYAVVVTAINSSGSITQPGIAYVQTPTPPQDVEIRIEPLPVVVGQSTRFSVKDPLQNYEYQWNFGDGTGTQRGITVTQTYVQAGAYVANVTGQPSNSADPVKQTDFVVVAYSQWRFPITMSGGSSPNPPTATPTSTPTATATDTPIPTNTSTGTPIPTNTPTATTVSSATPTVPTATSAPTATFIPTAPTATPTFTVVSPTATETATATETPTATFVPTAPTVLAITN